MMIIPPEKLLPWISTGENGEWVHAPNMPRELEEEFKKFVENEKEVRKKHQL